MQTRQRLSRLRFTARTLIVVHVKNPLSIFLDKGSSNFVHVKDPLSIFFDKGSSNYVHVKDPLSIFFDKGSSNNVHVKDPLPSFSTREALTISGWETHVTHDSRRIIEM